MSVLKREIGLNITNVYNSPRNPITLPNGEDVSFVRRIIAQSPEWGYTEKNASCHYIEDVCIRTNLIRLQNADSEPTQVHTGILPRFYANLSGP